MTKKDRAEAKRCKDKLITSLKRINPNKDPRNPADYKLYCEQCRLQKLCWAHYYKVEVSS